MKERRFHSWPTERLKSEALPTKGCRIDHKVSVAAVITLLISFLAVLWQTLKAAKTNPAEELKKE